MITEPEAKQAAQKVLEAVNRGELVLTTSDKRKRDPVVAPPQIPKTREQRYSFREAARFILRLQDIPGIQDFQLDAAIDALLEDLADS